MKSCAYCGHQNEDMVKHCVECGTEFQAPEEADPGLTDPEAALVTLATFGDLIHATFLRDELIAAGISACIPEDLASNPFGNFLPLARITVQVAARDQDAARQVLASFQTRSEPTDGQA